MNAYRSAVSAVTLLLSALGLASCSDSTETAAAQARYLTVPAMPRSTSPNLDVGAHGTAVLSWIEPAGDGHALRFSTLTDGDWAPARTVAEGDNWFVNWADFPSVVPVSDRLWGAHWLVSQPEGGYAYDVNIAISTDAGQTWSEALMPHSDGTPTEHGFVSLYRHDSGIGLVWLDGRNMINEYDPAEIVDGMTLRSAVFDAQGTMSHEQQIDGLICDCCQTDVAVTAAGPVAVYRDRSDDEIRDIYLSRFQDERWQPGLEVAADGWHIAACPVNGPAVEADGRRVAVAWFTAQGDVPTVRLAVSDDAGKSFSQPLDVAVGDNYGRVGLALLDDGELAVSWLRKAADNSGEVLISRVTPQGEVNAPFAVSTATVVSGFSFPQLARRGDALLVAWTSGSFEDSAIRSAIVPVSALP